MPIFVNDVEITDDAVFREMQYHPADTENAAMEEAARALTVQEILRQEAVEAEFLSTDAESDDVDKGIMALIQQRIQTPDASKDVCERYFEQNKSRFHTDKDMPVPAFELVEDKIRDYLHTRSIRHGIQSYILDTAQRYRISGFDLGGAI
jgi:hypothetical protein